MWALLAAGVLGALAGVFAGLFGVGGGILFVPTLTLVLGLTQIHAEATSLLAMLGATVVKVEPPGGDPARTKPVDDEPLVGTSPLYLHLNAGKLNASATAIGAWLPDVRTRTASRGLASSSCQVANCSGTPYSRAHADRSGSDRSHTAAISKRSDSSRR